MRDSNLVVVKAFINRKKDWSKGSLDYMQFKVK